MEGYAVMEKIDFDDTEIKLTRFPTITLVNRFKETAIPILMSNIKPVETFFSALVNEFAPSQGWGLVNVIGESEIETDRALLASFRVMLDFYLPEHTYTDDHLLKKIPISDDWLFQVVYSQIKIENLLESFLRRRIAFISDFSLLTGTKGLIDTDSIAQRISSVLRGKDADRELTGAGVK